jgi:hypothetical protein
MRSHTYDSGNAFDGFWQAAFVEITVIQHPSVRYVLKRIKVRRVTGIIANVELIIVH